MTTTVRVIQPDDSCCRNVIEPRVLETDARDQLLAVFKALADGTRLEVFRLIAAQEEPICACDVVDRFDVSQPTIAHHLKVLRQAGLIIVSRRGVWAYYALAPGGIDALEHFLSMMGVQPPVLLERAG
jgi:ArsR family transcriptional regulator